HVCCRCGRTRQQQRNNANLNTGHPECSYLVVGLIADHAARVSLGCNHTRYWRFVVFPKIGDLFFFAKKLTFEAKFRAPPRWWGAYAPAPETARRGSTTRAGPLSFLVLDRD